MTGAPKGLGARLRERKLVQWALAYLAGAWLLLQLLDMMTDRLAWPPLVFQVSLVLLAAGLVATLVLAWYHGEQGRQRVTVMELAIFAVLAVATGVGLTVLRGQPAATATPAASSALASEGASLVVLPFADLSPGGDQEYFSDGMTEEILNALVRVPGLRVPGRTTSFSFKAKELPIAEIGKQLGVAHVLEGSVRKDGDKLRITAQLIDARTDTHLWSETYDRQLADVFAMQEEISRAIVDALQVRLMGAQETALVKKSTDDLEAYNLYLQGRSYYNRRVGDNIPTAIAYFERTVARDPRFAAAWGALAASHALMPVFQNVRPEAHIRATKENAAKALALDSTLAEAHAAVAFALMASAENWPQTEREYQQALALEPSNAIVRRWHCQGLVWLGRTDDALRECERAVELDPRDAVTHAGLASLYAAQHRYDEAEAEYRRSSEIDPGYTTARANHIRDVYVPGGRTQRAVEEAQLLLDLPGRRVSQDLSAAGTAFAAAGDTGRARQMLRELDGRQAAGDFVSPFAPAAIHLALGERDRALTLLEQMVEQRAFYLSWGLSSPIWDPIRADPRFKQVLRKLGVGP